jgi:hypothetical protein
MTDAEFEKQIEAIDQQRRDDLITWEEAATKKLALKIERGAVVYIAMNEDADYEVGATEDEAAPRRQRRRPTRPCCPADNPHVPAEGRRCR